jgi:hypothetical protein
VKLAIIKNCAQLSECSGGEAVVQTTAPPARFHSHTQLHPLCRHITLEFLRWIFGNLGGVLTRKQRVWRLKRCRQEHEIAARGPDSVFPFVTCEPGMNHCTIAETGRLYEQSNQNCPEPFGQPRVVQRDDNGPG